MLREYAASEKAHPSAKAMELFQRALEIQADEATTKWEPGGTKERIHRHRNRVNAGTSRKRLGCKCAGRRRECGRAAGVGNEPWEIELWREAISWRRALLQAISEAQVADSTKNP